MTARTVAEVRALLHRPRGEAIRGALEAMEFMDDGLRAAAVDVIRALQGWDEVRAALRESPLETAEALVFLAEPELNRELVPLLSSPAADVRAAAISALARLEPDRHGPAFEAALTDADPAVRGQAALALVRAETPGREARLRTALAAETEIGARVLITDALWAVTGGW